MLKKLLSFLDKKTKIQILFIQMMFILTTFLEFLNLNFLLAFLTSIFTKNKSENAIPLFEFLNFNIFNSLTTSEIGVYLLFIFFLTSSFILISNYIIYYFSNYLTAKLTNTYFLRTLNANYFYILNKGTSGIIHDVSNQIPKISEGIIFPSLQLINKILLLIAILIFLFSNFFQITIKLLIISILMITMFYLVLKKYFYSFGVKVSKSQSEVIKSFYETFTNIKSIKIFNIEKFFLQKVLKNLKIYSKYQSLGYLFGRIPKFFFELLAISIITFVLIFFTINNDENIENLIPIIGTFAFVGYRLLPIFQELFTSLSMIKNSQFAANKILNKNLFKEKSFVFKNEKKLKLKINNLRIKNLYFKYPRKRKFLFKNFSSSFFRNKITTISGTSGVGKTTLVNILSGYIIPQKVNFDLNGKKVENSQYYNIIKEKFSYNEQRPNLFDTSIKQNVTLNFNLKKYNKKLYEKCLKAASLGEFMSENLKIGNVGDAANKLSGGQIQRILLARALYHQKEVIIFDEPTNFLDKKNKIKVINSIKNIKKKKIIIILSHDPDILKISDKIVKLS